MTESSSSSSKTNENQISSEQEEKQTVTKTTTTTVEKDDESDDKDDSYTSTTKKRSLNHEHETTATSNNTKDPTCDKEDHDEPTPKKSKVESNHDDKDHEQHNNNTEETDAPPKSIFGFGSSTSGFSAFKATEGSSGFGFGSASKSTSFGSGVVPAGGKLVFGQLGTSNTNGFGSSSNHPKDNKKDDSGSGSSSGFGSSNTAFKPFTKGFGSTDNEHKNYTTTNTELSGKETEEPSFTPIVQLPQSSEEITNGEENEESILSVRAKLFKLTKVEVASNVTVEAGSPDKAKVGGIEMATKVGTQVEDGSTSQKEESAKMDWKEVGIGPLRILTDDKHVRIVQRRENTPGGQGTKLILNIRLHEECRVERQADKFVKLAAFEVVDTTTAEKDAVKKFEMVQYLFKVKTVAEGDDLFATLKKYCKSK